MARPPAFSVPPTVCVTAVNLPFLGSRRNPISSFQYILEAIDAGGAAFSCPSWLVRREHFQSGDLIDFHLPFRTADGWHRHHAEVVSAQKDEAGTGQVCRTVFRDRQPLHHPVFASVETGEVAFRSETGGVIETGELLQRTLRDCLLLKQGVRVYMKHLVPLFSRITEFPTESYGELRGLLLEDVRRRIETNIARFEEWLGQAGRDGFAAGRDLDLESLRSAIEPEIENDLFEATFNAPQIRIYTEAIRLLEQKLYLNYNTIVLLYAKEL